jgi:site-specific recombinase XerD
MENLLYKKVRGLSIICNGCKSTVHKSMASKKGCQHPPEKQRYKLVFKKLGGQSRYVEVLETRDLIKAKKKASEVASLMRSESKTRSDNEILLSQGNFIAWVMKYGDYLENVDVPRHRQKKRGDKYIRETLQSIRIFLVYCNDNGIPANTLRIWSVEDSLVGEYYGYLEDKGLSNSTINRRIKDLRAFYKFLIGQGVLKQNIWLGFDLKKTSPTNKSVKLQEFAALLYRISPVDSKKLVGKTKRNMFRPWLRDVARMKAYSGLRDAELFSLTWDMLEFEDGRPVVLCSPNIKVNKAKNMFKAEELEYNYVPVGEELSDLLIELGLESSKGSADYIIAPKELRTESVIRQFQKSINFFFEKAFPEQNLRGKYLRHTYVTAINMCLPKISLTHASFRTTEKHYLDKKSVAIQIAKSNFRVFPKQSKDSGDLRKCTSGDEKQDTLKTKKGIQLPESLAVVGGRYWVRTSDPLLVRQVL